MVKPSRYIKETQNKFNVAKLKQILNINSQKKMGKVEKKKKKLVCKEVKKKLLVNYSSNISTSIDSLNSTHFSSDNNLCSSNVINPTDTIRQKLTAQLQSANFRILNEQLYTCSSSDASRVFNDDPAAFQAYHEGYALQVAQWPVNPLSYIISWLRKKPRTWTVADFGCGEAELSKSVPQKVHSFDLVAVNSTVIVCDMANTPLESKSVNVVVFCLSLMGTNINEFILEANRVLISRGILKIGEVESRFENVGTFLKHMFKFGFKCISKNQQNKYFWLFDFVKERDISSAKKLPEIKLKPCIYKKR